MKSGMKFIMENQQWLIILNVKYTFFFFLTLKCFSFIHLHRSRLMAYFLKFF